MKNNNISFYFMITVLLLPNIALSGFLDDLKGSINISAPKSKKCKTRADYYRKTQIGTLSPKSNIYSGPGNVCGVTARTDNGGTVQILGENGAWYYITIKNMRGKQIRGWTHKNNMSLTSVSPIKNDVKQIIKEATNQKNSHVQTHTKKPHQTYPKQMVIEVQNLLNQQGYSAGPADGIYGKGTRNAVLAFQHNSGLKETGNLDADTLSSLKNAQTSVPERKNTQLTKNKSDSSETGAVKKNGNVTKQKNGVSEDSIPNTDNDDRITFKTTRCYPKSLATQVYIDDSVDYLNHRIAKEILVSGAKYSQRNCLKFEGDKQYVHIFRKRDLSKKNVKSVVSATVYPYENDKLKDYKNFDGWKRDEDKRKAIVIEGDVGYENMKCNSYLRSNITNIYIEDNVDLTNHITTKKLLNRGIKHGSKVCVYKDRVESRIYPKSLQGKTNNNNLLAYLVYKNQKESKYYNSIAERIEYQNAKKKRRENLLNIISKSGVETKIQVDKLVANPFIYEDKIVIVKVLFSSMLSKDEALFARKKGFGRLIDAFLVTDVPTTRFSREKWMLLIGRVIGKKSTIMPTGGKLLLTQVEFIDAYEKEYKNEDLQWALKKLNIQ